MKGGRVGEVQEVVEKLVMVVVGGGGQLLCGANLQYTKLIDANLTGSQDQKKESQSSFNLIPMDGCRERVGGLRGGGRGGGGLRRGEGIKIEFKI